MSTQSQFWASSWDSEPSGKLPLIFGYSYGIGPFVPHIPTLPLPPVPKVSPDFEAKLLAKLGKGGVCPHGNLSEMESPASRRHRGLLLLADAQTGSHYSVSGIYERDRRLLEFLEARGVRPGARLRILERNYDQTLTLSTTAGTVSLGRAAADRVWVSAA